MKATIPKPAKILGILGLIPFCIALLSLLHPIFYNFLEKNFKTTGLEIQATVSSHSISVAAAVRRPMASSPTIRRRH